MNNINSKKNSEPAEVLDDNTVIQIGNKLFACKSIMEVTTEEDTQAVLLEGMEGTQYIIQRPDGDMGKGALFALTGELISEGMVVDMMSAGVGSEYNTGTQYYEGEDLLTHEMTEEDRRLADALVAVQQLQQQQKQQQLQSHTHHQDHMLQNVTHLANLSTVNTYSIQTIPDPDPSPVYPSIQTFKRVSQNVKTECINVKCEYEVDAISAENADEFSQNGPKRTLPHKKRKNWEERKHPRKVKQMKKNTAKNKESTRTAQETVSENTTDFSAPAFKCELCSSKFTTQLNFFEHLKEHYEPFNEEKCITQQTSTGGTISINISEPTVAQETAVHEIEEFSEPEDLMEGIRGVVEETEAHIDDETQNSLPTSNRESNIWTLPDNNEQDNQKSYESTSTINKNDLKSSDTTEPTTTTTTTTATAAAAAAAAATTTTTVTKKRKGRTKTVENLVCRQCDRTFHHKNSLVYHMRSHSGERPHQCEICGKSFFAASALKVHKRLHSGDKPYKCEECGRHFRQWGDLKYHSTSLHSEQKQFQCEYCGKDFARKYSLIVHRRIHTGEKNYLCEYCNKTFRASSYLQNHRRIHTGEKPHPCTICGKPFRVRSDMKRHMHTHTRSRNERPANRSIAPKNTQNEEDKANSSKARTIQDLVHELKLEVEPNGAVEIVPAPSPESILPHEGTQTLEYEVTNANDSSNEKDPLEAVVRTGDTLPYYFM